MLDSRTRLGHFRRPRHILTLAAHISRALDSLVPDNLIGGRGTTQFAAREKVVFDSFIPNNLIGGGEQWNSQLARKSCVRH